MKKRYPLGAGFVFVRNYHDINECRILALSINGKYDLPKGEIEDLETPIRTALREAQEEAGITSVEMPWGTRKLVLEHLTFFVGTTYDDPVIRPNPDNGIIEHDDAGWILLEDFEDDCLSFLSPTVPWIRKIIKETIP